jgi:hypothetical protein
MVVLTLGVALARVLGRSRLRVLDPAADPAAVVATVS